MINTFSSCQSAIDAIPDFCSQVEQDIFVYYVRYPWGEEWSLRTRDQVMDVKSENIVYEFYLPIDHRFCFRDNAIREAEVWMQRLNQAVTLDRHINIKKGYKEFSHYTLTTQ